jgi:antirestriction protein
MSTTETEHDPELLAEWSDGTGVPVSAIIAWLDTNGQELTEASADELVDSYQGEHDSPEAFCMELAEDCGMLDDSATWPTSCIDWAQAWRELRHDGFWSTWSDGTVYVFRSV